MKKFVVSDLHGCGDVYDPLMGYLENIKLATGEDVQLFINGDLIDRGLDSCRILLDVKKRCDGFGNINIKYLAGNHEMLFYETALRRDEEGNFPLVNDWTINGGFITAKGLKKLDKSEVDKIVDFIGNLDIYHKFEEVVDGKNVLLVHAQAPHEIRGVCNLKLKADDKNVFKALWTRKDKRNSTARIGQEGYLTIIGHTPVKDGHGIYYLPDESVINIDGGCATYACSDFSCDHVPVVEVCDGRLEIIIFNHNNEITSGFYYDGEFKEMSESELNKKRIFIDHTYDNCAEKCQGLIKKMFD